MASFYESMTLPTLFGVIAAIGIGCGLLLLAFARPLQRLEHGESAAAVAPSSSPVVS
jgi:hypothetical protein